MLRHNEGEQEVDMTWQQWLGRGLIALNAIVLAIGAFLGVPMDWWQPVMVAITGIVNVIISLIH
jgi:hypothetical protein